MKSTSNNSISVIIPCYNRRHTLARAIDSVLGQEHSPDEIIVVDDGSCDGTVDLIHEQFPDIMYLRQENQGVSAARNAGIKIATSNWIAFLDSDDEWLPEKLGRQLETLISSCLRVCHSEEIWIRNGKRVNAMNKHKKYGGHIFPYCLPRCVISPSAVMLHRDIFSDYGLFDESLPACEDYDLWLKICSQEAVSFIETPLIMKYGGHDDQLSRMHWGMDRFRVQALENILTTDNLNDQYRRLALTMLEEKLTILLSGARKRANEALIEELTTKLTQCKADQLEQAS